MSFEEYRCMMKNEDQDDEEYAVCQYPKCWLEDCPHKQARDRLVEVEKLPEKWRGTSKTKHYKMIQDCADDLVSALHGEGG